MRVRAPFAWPDDKAAARRRAKRLEWTTLFFMTTIVVAMYFTLGSSQAMKTAWIEDLLGFIPAILFLVAARIGDKPPNNDFPFGLYKAVPIAYLVASTAILGMGLYLFYDSGSKLIMREHPTIGLMTIFGYDVWMGWPMIAALAYSIVPPVILGRMKLPIAKEIHDKVLLADATMQKADWLTGVAAILGIIGIGFGLWWADSAAAAVISIDVVKDGGTHVWRAMRDLADEIPREADKKDAPMPLIGQLCDVARQAPWVQEAEAQLRDEGHTVTGIIYVEAEQASAAQVAALQCALESVDWRIYNPVVTVVPPGTLSERKS